MSWSFMFTVDQDSQIEWDAVTVNGSLPPGRYSIGGHTEAGITDSLSVYRIPIDQTRGVEPAAASSADPDLPSPGEAFGELAGAAAAEATRKRSARHRKGPDNGAETPAADSSPESAA